MKTNSNVPMNTSHSHTHIGALIDRGLAAKEMSLRVLAGYCGVAASYLTRLKQGKVRHPREDVLVCMARTLGQEIEDYRIALLADHGDLPSWGKVLGTELGIRLSTEDEQAITQFVKAMLKARRGE